MWWRGIRTYLDGRGSSYARWRLAAVSCVIGLGVAYMWLSKDSLDGKLGILTAVGSVMAWMGQEIWAFLQPAGQPVDEDPTMSLADRLATALLRQWRPEVIKRKLGPNRIDVAWRFVPALDRPGPRWRRSTDWIGPAEVPGADLTAASRRPEGTAADLSNLYVSLPHGRLVIQGGPGSGKTSILLTLLITALKQRDNHPATERAFIPVPVFLSLADWQPRNTGIVEFVAETLARDIPALRSDPATGPTLRQMIESGGVCLFLDGLEDLTERERAIQEMNYVPHLRMVLTSRPETYAEATRPITAPPNRQVRTATSLEGAAVVELLPVSEAASRTYVEGAEQGGDDWERVLRRLANVASTGETELSSPLYLSLLIQSYRDRSPAELLDEELFPTAESIAAHLIDQIIPQAYPDGGRWSADRAYTWLSFLAHGMTHDLDGTRSSDQPASLSWSYISEWAPAWLTRSVYSTAIGLLIAGGSWLAIAGSQPERAVLGQVAGYVPLIWALTTSLSYLLALVLDLRLTRQPVVGVSIGVATGCGLGMLGGLLVTVELARRTTLSKWTALLVGDGLGFLLGTGMALFLVLVGLRSEQLRKRRKWPSAFGRGRPSWGAAGALALMCGLFLASRTFSVRALLLVGLSFLIAVGADSLLSAQETMSGAASARESVRHDLAAWAAIGVFIGICGTLLLGTVFEARTIALPGWFAMLFIITLLSSHTSGYLLAVGYFALTGRLPWIPLRFLDDAWVQGVMRRNGWRYEFRHGTLRDRLSGLPGPTTTPTGIDLRPVVLPTPTDPDPPETPAPPNTTGTGGQH